MYDFDIVYLIYKGAFLGSLGNQPQAIDLEAWKEAKALEEVYRLISNEEPESFYEDVLSIKDNQ